MILSSESRKPSVILMESRKWHGTFKLSRAASFGLAIAISSRTANNVLDDLSAGHHEVVVTSAL